MGDISASYGNLDVVMNVNDDATKKCDDTTIDDHVPLLQKVTLFIFEKINSCLWLIKLIRYSD